GADEAVWSEAGTCGSHDCVLEIRTASRPVRLDVDPEFDIMRRLDVLEVPPALTTLFGADSTTFVLPSAADPGERDAWRALAADWAKPDQPRVVADDEIDELPPGSVWILGWDNAFADEVSRRVADQNTELTDASVVLPTDELPRAGHSLVLVSRAADDDASALGLVAADPVAAIPGLARKLPHYTRYSYLGFKGSEPENVAKGMWRPLSSPLVRNLTDGELAELKLPARKPLAELPAVFDAARLAATVTHLSQPDFGGRGLGSAGLEAATAWVEAQFAAMKLGPNDPAGYRQRWSWRGGEPERTMELTNLVGVLPGADPKLAPVLVTAHLDHLGEGWPDVRTGNEGRIHPGADDNASGVAVLLELARSMASEPQRARTTIFAVVTGEEAGRVGSKHLLDQMPETERPYACVNLDTVGRLGGGELFVLNTDSAREWRFIFMGVGYTTGAPIKVVPEPLDSSDQMSCIEKGVPAIQLFTGPTPDYHRPSDTAAAIDADGMATVAEATHEAVVYLAERLEPLTVTITGEPATGHPGGAPNEGARRASLGTMPDFGFSGPGVRVQQVMPGSAAEKAGLVAGDVLTAFDGEPVTDLRGYSTLLKSRQPGDAVEVTVLRGGEEVTVTATLGER
ncbi:MAG: M20/M25/M40 family metallo-hydrolase, partial [Candidatus Sulfomarinibacteraceae bacterium]